MPSEIYEEWRITIGTPRYQVLERSVDAWMQAHPGQDRPDAETVWKWMCGDAES